MRNLLCVALLLGGIAYAQTSLTPLVAKQRQLYFRINPDGSETLVQEARGIFVRDSSGRTLSNEGAVINGAAQAPATGIYKDKASGKTYQLDYRAKTATLRSVMTPEMLSKVPPIEEARKRAVAEEVIHGISSLCFPALDGKTGATIGLGCRSFEYDLEMKREAVLTLGGERTKSLWELYDVQLGVAPTEPVEIPTDFRVVE